MGLLIDHGVILTHEPSPSYNINTSYSLNLPQTFPDTQSTMYYYGCAFPNSEQLFRRAFALASPVPELLGLIEAHLGLIPRMLRCLIFYSAT